MAFNDILFSHGIVTYDDFNINPEISFDEQPFDYKEDLFQVNYGNMYILDIGWSPEFSSNGSFKIVLVKELDWQHPIYKKSCTSLSELKHYVIECNELAKTLVNKT